MKSIIKWIVIIFIALVVIGLIFGSDDTSETTTSSESVAEVAETAIAVTAQQLYSAYENNEVAADKQFKGKLLEITGTVGSIDSGMSDNAMVQLNTSNDFMSVTAQGDDSFDDTAATLSKGQQVTLLCRGDGEIIGSPMVDECVFQ